ncbi:hypothetical protein Mal15_65130 [Stieleria maiorica]|uniref:Uncharacterized protein n=1 Tax=Stieleria maiorica TaxID=2795974 RepID=A0A5B9MLW8_9BACT|nr:hypothetical protein [Stieleria maiorica]QEG02392.1 hypothetical protein Mal15_65130 [Stieleria maiorica]
MNELQEEIKKAFQDHSLEYWVEEQIWGHRIWDNQTPWLMFLELLGIADYAHSTGKLLDESGKFYPLIFHPQRRMMLRNVLYNNQIMPYLLDKFPDDNRAWKEWQQWMNDNARGIVERDFSYIPKRFGSFDEFTKLVAMLRSATVESESNRRWSSRFLFPFGRECLFEDVRVTAGGTPSREYINFGRTGELLYLMLCRSQSSKSLTPHLAGVVTSKNPWNALVGQLQPGKPDQTDAKGKSFLPYKSHSTFDLLGEDWLHVFDLNLPRFDAYPHITLLGAFHVMLYQLTIAREVAAAKRPIIVCEMVAPQKTLVRELSIRSFQENSQLSELAITAFINRIAASDEWKQALSATDAYPQCKEILNRRVGWPREETNYGGNPDPDALLKNLRQRAMTKHRQHAGNVHRTYGRAVGLISKRGTNKLRYAPNDSLLKALILANVKDRMEFKAFLRLLFDRYGIVLGEREAETVMDDSDFDKKSFQANATRLEQRLSSLGMVKRLSDACAYVLNPYSEASR